MAEAHGPTCLGEAAAKITKLCIPFPREEWHSWAEMIADAKTKFHSKVIDLLIGHLRVGTRRMMGSLTQADALFLKARQCFHRKWDGLC
jgi:hypothetical protein